MDRPANARPYLVIKSATMTNTIDFDVIDAQATLTTRRLQAAVAKAAGDPSHYSSVAATLRTLAKEAGDLADSLDPPDADAEGEAEGGEGEDLAADDTTDPAATAADPAKTTPPAAAAEDDRDAALVAKIAKALTPMVEAAVDARIPKAAPPKPTRTTTTKTGTPPVSRVNPSDPAVPEGNLWGRDLTDDLDKDDN